MASRLMRILFFVPLNVEVLDTFKIKSGGCDTVAVTLVGVEYLLSESIDAIQ